jgi:hypothetical protein
MGSCTGRPKTHLLPQMETGPECLRYVVLLTFRQLIRHILKAGVVREFEEDS